MPLSLSSFAASPASVAVPGDVTTRITVWSTSLTDGTNASVSYSLDTSHNVYFAGNLKVTPAVSMAVPLAPGQERRDTLSLVFGAGQAESPIGITITVQEMDVSQKPPAPIGPARKRSVFVMVTGGS